MFDCVSNYELNKNKYINMTAKLRGRGVHKQGDFSGMGPMRFFKMTEHNFYPSPIFKGAGGTLGSDHGK